MIYTELEFDTNGVADPLVDLGGEEKRQATWADVDKFSNKAGYNGRRDLIEMYNWKAKRDKCKGGPWRPKQAWILDEGGCDLYATYGWKPVTLHIVPVCHEILERTMKPLIIQEFVQTNESNKPGKFIAQGSRMLTASTSVSKKSEKVIGFSTTTSVTVKASPFGLGGEYGFSMTGSFSHTFGETETWSRSESTGMLLRNEVTLDPGEKIRLLVQGEEGTLKIRVHYKMFLSGHIAADHGEKKFDGHHYWKYDVGKVLSRNGARNEIMTHEDIELQFYGRLRQTQLPV